jgi:hypothetical protein
MSSHSYIALFAPGYPGPTGYRTDLLTQRGNKKGENIGKFIFGILPTF